MSTDAVEMWARGRQMKSLRPVAVVTCGLYANADM